VYNLRFGPAVAVFLLLSALAHLALSTFGYKWYVAKLKSGMNPARFYEYTLSSSLMIVLIGMLVGVSDLGALILMFGINAMMNLFGILMELHNQTTKKTDWTSYISSSFCISMDHSAPQMPNHRPSCTLSSRPSLCSSASLLSTWSCSIKRSVHGRTISLVSACISS
jgi:hypothetical protein